MKDHPRRLPRKHPTLLQNLAGCMHACLPFPNSCMRATPLLWVKGASCADLERSAEAHLHFESLHVTQRPACACASVPVRGCCMVLVASVEAFITGASGLFCRYRCRRLPGQEQPLHPRPLRQARRHRPPAAAAGHRGRVLIILVLIRDFVQHAAAAGFCSSHQRVHAKR